MEHNPKEPLSDDEFDAAVQELRGYAVQHFEAVPVPARVEIEVLLPHTVEECRQGTHICGDLDGMRLLSRRIAQAIKEATL